MRRRYLFIAICATFIGFNLAILFWLLAFGPPSRVEQIGSTQERAARIEEMHSIDNSESVSPGGQWRGLCPKDNARTLEQFHAIVDADKELSAHFAGFAFERAYEIETMGPTRHSVAHRNCKDIVYTRKAINIPAGDRQVTDGRRVVRLGCCNDIVTVPYVPSDGTTMIGQLPPEEDLPPIYTPPDPLQPTTPFSPVIGPPERVRISAPVSTYSVAPEGSSSPAPVPEPGTMILFGVGIAILSLAGRGKR